MFIDHDHREENDNLKKKLREIHKQEKRQYVR